MCSLQWNCSDVPCELVRRPPVEINGDLVDLELLVELHELRGPDCSPRVGCCVEEVLEGNPMKSLYIVYIRRPLRRRACGNNPYSHVALTH